MPGRRSFKADESFLEKLAIGAIGARAVFQNLARQHHKPIELERGSMGYKIWKQIKIKRLRVPDLLCLACGIRVEARAKTSLEISMSHSVSDPDRGWDAGLLDEDVVALSECVKTGDNPIDWKASSLIQYVPVRALRKAFRDEKVSQERPKGAGEGFELRITWPSAVASSAGVVDRITGERLQFKRAGDQRTISVSLKKKSIMLRPLVKTGTRIAQGQIIASVVPVTSVLACQQGATVKIFQKLLGSASVADRYAAAKALAHFDADSIVSGLRQRITDTREHIYVRLECAAGLMRRGSSDGGEFIKQTLRADYLEHRLEAVIILGEIPSDSSLSLLIEVLLDREQHPEIRAGAAWALGELEKPASVDALVRTFLELAEPIRVEAARALRKIALSTDADVAGRLASAQDDQRAGIAWAVSRARRVDIGKLMSVMVDDDARRWVAYILGTQDEKTLVGRIEELRARDSEVYFAVTVLWKILSSWIYDLKEY
jgi:hypothetical protein